MLFFVRQKVQISSTIFPQIPKFANFVKFRQKSIFSSRRPVFVISSVFRQKRNPLEPKDSFNVDRISLLIFMTYCSAIRNMTGFLKLRHTST